MDTKKYFLQILNISAICIITLFLINRFNISYPVAIVTTNKTTELAVVGEGKVDVIPDFATVQAGIVVNNAVSIQEAQKTITDTNNNIVAALKNLGILAADIKTTNISVRPDYTYKNNRSQIIGYNGNASVTVKVRDTKRMSQVIDAATTAGANEVNASGFVVEKPEKYREQAREKAIANAKEQAEKLAKRLGIRLGKIVNIVELSPNGQPEVYYGKRMMADSAFGGDELTIEPGSQTISSIVTLYFEKL